MWRSGYYPHPFAFFPRIDYNRLPVIAAEIPVTRLYGFRVLQDVSLDWFVKAVMYNPQQVGL